MRLVRHFIYYILQTTTLIPRISAKFCKNTESFLSVTNIAIAVSGINKDFCSTRRRACLDAMKKICSHGFRIYLHK